MRSSKRLKVGRVALLAVAVVALGGGAVSNAATAVDPIGPAPTPSGQTWIVTLLTKTDVALEAEQLVRRQGGRLVAVYSHVLHGFAFSGSTDAATALARDPRVAHIEASGTLHVVEIAPYGILRTSAWAAHQAGYTGVTSGGAPVRVAVVDTGIKLDHVDLASNIASGLGTNCISPGQAASDDHGHGTHVAGTVAAAFNGQGVVGMATNAQLIPVKVIDSTGYGTDAQVICGLDYVAGLAQSQPGPYVVNMSLGDPNRPGETTCGSSALHQAICDLTNAGVTVVAAAGNDGGDAASFVPAAYDEVIAVSAFTDFDGQRSYAGCQLDFSEYGYQCDDTLADFSNYGSVVDVTAPGVHVLSDWIDGGLTTISGTSMAAPHVAGAAALVLAVNPTLTPAEVRSILETTGECPDGLVSGAPTCTGHGQWEVGSLFGNHPDPDGIPEPLVNAVRAAQAAGAPPPPGPDTTPPTVALTAPAADAVVRGTVVVTANASDNVGVTRVDFYDGLTLIGSDTSAPYSVPWATAGDGAHTLTATAFDATGLNASDSRPVSVDNTPPVVTLRSPTGGTVSGAVGLTADASDPVPGSGVSKVEFLVDGTIVATDTSSPYAATWNSATVANGTHSLTARGTDTAGNTSTSPPTAVTVSNTVVAVVTHVASLNGYGQLGPRSWKSWVQVTIADLNGQPVDGVTVTFAISGGATTTRSCTTGSNGACTTAKITVPNSAPSVTYVTTAVAKSATTWDGIAWGVTLTK